MSKCQLTGTKRLKKQQRSITRSKLSKSTTVYSQPNGMKRKLELFAINKSTQESVTIINTHKWISHRTMRTIDKCGGLKEFLISRRQNELTEFGYNLKQKYLRLMIKLNSDTREKLTNRKINFLYDKIKNK